MSVSKTLPRLARRAASTVAVTPTTKAAGDISSVFPSLSGKKATPLPGRFTDLKVALSKGREEQLSRSWVRLLASLKEEVAEVKKLGSNAIPSIEYSDVKSGKITDSQLAEIRHRGSVVIRNVVPRSTALEYKAMAREYIAANKERVKAFPPDDPAVYELYWTPSQVHARAHPDMLTTQHFLQNLWHSSDPESPISTSYPLTYADRFRIRSPGDTKFTLGPHIDGGSLERWEDPEYSSVYHNILEGNWETHDSFDARHRINARMDLYNGAGACAMFRFFQGWLSMTDTGPGEGTLKLCPLLKHATAYLILRPFFTNDSSATNNMNLDSSFPGSVPGACQEYCNSTHPALDLDSTMVSVPRVEPGDYVAWHCDTIHMVDQLHSGTDESSVLYIPTCPITPPNIEALIKQREAAAMYSPPPDYPGAGGPGEMGFQGAVDWSGLSGEGLRAMGMEIGGLKWEVKSGMGREERKVVELANGMCFG